MNKIIIILYLLFFVANVSSQGLTDDICYSITKVKKYPRLDSLGNYQRVKVFDSFILKASAPTAAKSTSKLDSAYYINSKGYGVLFEEIHLNFLRKKSNKLIPLGKIKAKYPLLYKYITSSETLPLLFLNNQVCFDCTENFCYEFKESSFYVYDKRLTVVDSIQFNDSYNFVDHLSVKIYNKKYALIAANILKIDVDGKHAKGILFLIDLEKMKVISEYRSTSILSHVNYMKNKIVITEYSIADSINKSYFLKFTISKNLNRDSFGSFKRVTGG